MKTGLRRTLLALVIVSQVMGQNSALAIVHLPPELDTPAKIEEHQKYVYDELPWLGDYLAGNRAQKISQMGAVFSNEATLLPKVRQNEEFRRLEPLKPELQTINVNFVTSESRQVKVLKEVVLRRWKTELLKLLEQNQGTLTKEAVTERTNQYVSELGGLTSRGVLTGIIMALPKPLAGHFFKEPSFETLVASLKSEASLTDDLLKQTFRSNTPIQDISKNSLLDLAIKLRQIELNLLNYLQVSWIMNSMGVQTLTSGDLSAMKNESLVLFGESLGGDKLKATIEDLARSTPGADKTLPVVVDSVMYSGDFEAEPRMVNRDKVVDSFSIREAPPSLGVWRGYLGGDCSTTNCFAYTYSPMERTYYVFDSKGVAKGYVMSTVVQVDGQNVLYLHDVTGNHLSPDLAEAVMNALYLAKDQLGMDIKEITVPTDDVFYFNNNFVPLREVFKRYTKGAVGVKQTYVDSQLRRVFHGHPGSGGAEKPYDLPEFNVDAFLFRPNEKLAASLRVQVVENTSFKVEDKVVPKVVEVPKPKVEKPLTPKEQFVATLKYTNDPRQLVALVWDYMEKHPADLPDLSANQLKLVASTLENEHEPEGDLTSSKALSILFKYPNLGPEVLKLVKGTFKYEETKVMRRLAAIILAKNGVIDNKILRALERATRNRNLSDTAREQAAEILRANPEVKCAIVIRN